METYLIEGEIVREDDDGVLRQVVNIGNDDGSLQTEIYTFGIQNPLGRIYRVVRLWDSNEYITFTDGMARFGFSKVSTPSAGGHDPEFGSAYSEIYYRESEAAERASHVDWAVDGHITTLTDANFHEAINGGATVLVDFWAEWCGPCKELAGVLGKIAQERAEHLRVARLNIDDQKETANKYNIRSIPTTILFKAGEVAFEGVGNRPKAYWDEKIDEHM